ncbi:CHASE2 domain-containing protein [Brevibacillus sp. SYSU BS000544]|uniref:CHASE2 domain-containing protein n=1 Tax=Brevibacillus sp. SYSU BS000544 TaxID=3416443 RepID=UPI003CE56356
MKKTAHSLMVSMLIMLVIGWMYQWNILNTIETYYYDRVTNDVKRPIDTNIVIVGIDDYSLENLGRWPWPRSIHADLVERIAQSGPKAIGLDLLLTEASVEPAEDEAIQQVLAKYPNIIVPSYFVFSEDQEKGNQLQYERLLRPVYSIPAQQTAHINVFAHRGEVVRQVLLGIPDDKQQMMPAFSVKLANMLLPPEKHIVYENGVWKQGNTPIPTNERNQVYIPFAQPPGGFAPVSYFDVLSMDEEAMSEFFRDKVVLIGPYSLTLGDQYLTPMRSATKMYGIEIHANMIQAIEDQLFIKVTEGKEAWIGWILIFVLTFLIFELTRRLRAQWALLAFFALFVGFSLLAFQLNKTELLVIPYVYPVLALITGYVAAIITRYVFEWREKNRVTMLFGRYVSKQVVNEILQSEAAQNLGGTRRNVSIMFVDIRGFTPLSERIQPEEVIQVLNEYLDLCTKAVFQFDGTLDKFIGDGVMAIFGAPNSLENHPELAVRAALEMKKGSSALVEKLTAKYGYAVSFGIGINTGDAVIGNIGSQNRLDYTAIGDNVNMAARLESNAKPGQILISSSTYEQVKDLFDILPLGEIKVKGKEKPVAIYQVVGEIGVLEHEQTG